MSVLFPGVGGLLLILLALDVFVTVFSSGGRGGPINRRQNQLIWALCRTMAGRGSGDGKSRLLGRAGSFMVVSTLAIWVLWLVVASALVYYPWMDRFLVSPGELRTPVFEALYYSGYTAATLGLGDLIPDVTGLRLLTLIQAFGGFALLSTAVTYFLAVYREVIDKEALAMTITTRAAAAGDERGLADEADPGALGRWCEKVSGGLAQVLMGHHQYPVLHYFRSRAESRSLPVQLGHLVRLRAAVRAGSGGTGGGMPHPLTEQAGYRQLEQTLDRYLREVEALFIPERVAGDEPDDGAPVEGVDALERSHRRLLRFMLYA